MPHQAYQLRVLLFSNELAKKLIVRLLVLKVGAITQSASFAIEIVKKETLMMMLILFSSKCFSTWKMAQSNLISMKGTSFEDEDFSYHLLNSL